MEQYFGESTAVAVTVVERSEQLFIRGGIPAFVTFQMRKKQIQGIAMPDFLRDPATSALLRASAATERRFERRTWC
jgi:hypothetical protein